MDNTPISKTFTFMKPDNQELIENSKKVQGNLYHRINTLQRELNIAREYIVTLESKVKENENR